MDFDEATGKSPTLDGFTAKYGTKVNYQEVVNDNETFFGTIQPPLQAGQDTGWDLVVLTDWMAARLIRLGWAETIDTANTPNFVANVKDVYKGVDWDPDTNLRAPYQSGMTGLGFDKDVTGDLTSLAALWTDDPRWNGKVWFLTEMRDSVGLTLLKLGYTPEDFTQEQADEAFAEIQTTVDAGIVRSFLGNEYKESLVKGDLVLGTAWSGDIIIAQDEKASLVFRIPDEGGMLWTDNMLIPKGAQHKYTAELMIDWVYDPVVAAQLAAFIWYVTPVNGCQEELARSDDPETAALAENPLIFPDDATLAKVHIFRGLDEAEETYLNDEFSKVQGT
jgi:spermidine/putrescine transport system substrate-binding protein